MQLRPPQIFLTNPTIQRLELCPWLTISTNRIVRSVVCRTSLSPSHFDLNQQSDVFSYNTISFQVVNPLQSTPFESVCHHCSFGSAGPQTTLLIPVRNLIRKFIQLLRSSTKSSQQRVVARRPVFTSVSVRAWRVTQFQSISASMTRKTDYALSFCKEQFFANSYQTSLQHAVTSTSLAYYLLNYQTGSYQANITL